MVATRSRSKEEAQARAAAAAAAVLIEGEDTAFMFIYGLDMRWSLALVRTCKALRRLGEGHFAELEQLWMRARHQGHGNRSLLFLVSKLVQYPDSIRKLLLWRAQAQKRQTEEEAKREEAKPNWANEKAISAVIMRIALDLNFSFATMQLLWNLNIVPTKLDCHVAFAYGRLDILNLFCKRGILNRYKFFRNSVLAEQFHIAAYALEIRPADDVQQWVKAFWSRYESGALTEEERKHMEKARERRAFRSTLLAEKVAEVQAVMANDPVDPELSTRAKARVNKAVREAKRASDKGLGEVKRLLVKHGIISS